MRLGVAFSSASYLQGAQSRYRSLLQELARESPIGSCFQSKTYKFINTVAMDVLNGYHNGFCDKIDLFIGYFLIPSAATKNENLFLICCVF